MAPSHACPRKELRRQSRRSKLGGASIETWKMPTDMR
jgi:hypothetical protein